MTNQDSIDVELKALVGKTWAEAFRVFVIEHPDVAMCVDQVVRDLPDLDPFFDKCLITIFSYRRWPVSLKEVDLAGRIFYESTASKRAVRRVAYGKVATTLEHDPNIDIPDSVQQVAELIKDRYALFIRALQSGDLSIHGVSGKSGLPMDIPRGEWENGKLAVDIAVGGLWEGRRAKTGQLYRAMEIALLASATDNFPTIVGTTQPDNASVEKSTNEAQSPRGPEPVINNALAWKLADHLLEVVIRDSEPPWKREALLRLVEDWMGDPNNGGRPIKRSTAQRFCKKYLPKSTSVENLRDND